MKTCIAIDAMGGDKAPKIVFEGLELFIKNHPNVDIEFLAFGQESVMTSFMTPELSKHVRLHHAEEVITGQLKPALAVRMGRRPSMGMAIDAVNQGIAHAVVSAGNTGAFMALSKIILKTFDGIDRPAIPALIPSDKGCTLVLDLGANIECSAENLVQFAVMGSAYMRKLMNIENPSVGILNVGSEDLKGNQIVQAAAHFLRDHPLVNFHGFVEGDDIAKATVDVVVTDGFTGNIVLKAIEGTVRLFAKQLKKSLSGTVLGKIGALMAKPSLADFKRFIDPRLYNGAMFLGLRSIVIKSHGGTDGVGFANAVQVADEMVRRNVIPDLQAGLEGIQ
ncbi:MAG: phosphate acyltransferase PlsX [Pseudomonadota bacterium]|jgi:glycerol-3-phosphate acyltransferase PlsX|nr:phosphate acyltransferase PlsX [Alphaproteobacteria bacterium]